MSNDREENVTAMHAGDAAPSTQLKARPAKLTMTRPEFAAFVGISRSKLERLLASGDVSCARLGGRVLFTEAHAVELLQKFEHKAIVRKERPSKTR